MSEFKAALDKLYNGKSKRSVRFHYALLVFELARTHASTPLAFMSSRNVRPLFVNRPFVKRGRSNAAHHPHPSADDRHPLALGPLEYHG